MSQVNYPQPQKFPFMSQVNYPQPQTIAQTDVAVTLNIQLMIAAIIFLFMVVVFIFFLHIYIKHYMGSISRSRSRTRFIFAADRTPVATDSHGLDAEILNSLPVAIYKSSDFKEGLECAVCLAELTDGERARILPKCNHGFHIECIDMWFHSHSTCPLCRAPITKDAFESSELETGHSNFPTNVLFWGNGNEVGSGVGVSREGTSLSSLSLKRGNEGMLVIDIPRRGSSMEDIASPLGVGKSPMDEVRTPSSGRLRSLRRLLSRGKMVIGSYSPRGGDHDVERGVVGEASGVTPKTPLS